MPDTIRQRIVNELKLRLAAITIANGYATDLGTEGLNTEGEIEEWAIAGQDEDLPLLSVFDLDNESTQSYPEEGQIPNLLPFQVRFFLKRETTPAKARLYLGDVMRAIITDPETGERDPTWGGLVIDTKPTQDGFIRDKETFQVDAGAVGFTVEFYSEPFNAYQ